MNNPQKCPQCGGPAGPYGPCQNCLTDATERQRVADELEAKTAGGYLLAQRERKLREQEER